MEGSVTGESLAVRARIAFLLLAGVAVLLALLVLSGNRGRAYGGLETIPSGVRAHVQAAVDTLFRQHGLEASGSRTWHVRGPSGRVLRIEQRVAVPPGFQSLLFNHELSSRVAEVGARVVGTERSREGSVTLHIESGGAVFRSITFTVDPHLAGHDTGKEEGHR